MITRQHAQQVERPDGVITKQQTDTALTRHPSGRASTRLSVKRQVKWAFRFINAAMTEPEQIYPI